MGHVLISPRLHGHPATFRVSARGMWAWVASICWLSRNGRVDRFPVKLAREFEATPKVTAALIEEGLWIDAGTDVIVPQEVPTLSGQLIQLWKFGPLDRTRPKIPIALRQEVYERDGRRCLHCGATDRLSLDHIHPWSLGGPDTLENLQTLCRPCNSRKGARI